MKLRVFKILKHTKVEGPGTRYCIWVQGCSRHCKGCQSPQTWPNTGGKLYETSDLIKDILNQPKIEGVTFLGGEPFEQAEALGEIAEAVKREGLSVLCFTGNLIENLYKSEKNKKLLDNTDLLIDGDFQIEKSDYSRPWCGSTNQRYHFLTDKYNEDIFEKYKNKVEINISENGTIFMNGMGNFDDIMQKVDLVRTEKCYK
jgi:anaerobic ribonucleoside-triphosphate reductase activating protein